MLSLFPEGLHPLPDFRAILVKGQYHPSAPIHLALSHSSQGLPGALILTPSRNAILHTVQTFNDEWLNRHSASGRVMSCSSNVQVLYPPSPVHLALLLSSFRTLERAETSTWNSKTTFTTAPSLIILHELSSYFIPENDEQVSESWTVSSYLSLVIHALASISFLTSSSSPPLKLALFDSRLDSLKLPVVRPRPFRDVVDSEHEPHLQPVSFFVEKYFELMLVFSYEDERHFLQLDYSSEDSSVRKRVCVSRLGTAPFETETWRYVEVRRKGHADRPNVSFQFQANQ